MKFSLDKQKAVEAIVFIAQQMPGVGRFHASKALYFAELEHLRNYGRPIVGDRYVAMDNGPVPSFSYDVLKGNLVGADKELVEGALEIDTRWRHPKYKAARTPNLELFSQSDLECLRSGIEHVNGKSFGSISDETHQHPGWKNADLNSLMSFDDMLEGADPAIVESAKEFAAYGVL
ncbi:Panacea domain-containing protein [Mesorhizobium sp.]|uniref:Panacea domain-containing protein n=1 Tax=Mesorhizobium sp. TaxID=1871066 RepID=UPI0025C1AC0E|nr:Panacea domain-containing protein [Mesorhizobium sp.]